MTMHHAMAVMMARPAAAQAAHQETKDLAQAIITDQTRETAEMCSWAKDWYGIDLPDHLAMMDQTMGQGQGMPGMNPSGIAPGMGMSMQGGMPMGQMGDMLMIHNMSMMSMANRKRSVPVTTTGCGSERMDHNILCHRRRCAL